MSILSTILLETKCGRSIGIHVHILYSIILNSKLHFKDQCYTVHAQHHNSQLYQFYIMDLNMIIWNNESVVHSVYFRYSEEGQGTKYKCGK